MIYINIGGFIIAIFSKNTVDIEESYHQFISEKQKEKPDVLLNVRYDSFPEFASSAKKIFSTPVYSIYQNRKEYFFYFYDFPHKIPYKILRFNPEQRTGEIYLKDRSNAIPMEYPVDQILFLLLLSLNNGVILHSLGIDYQGRGLVFAGKSGAGKTTLAKSFQGKNKIRILNDDRVILRKIKEKFYLYGTPWHGDFKNVFQGKAECKKIFFLKKDRKNVIKRLTMPEAVSKLISCSFLPFWDKEKINVVLKFYSELVSKIPAFDFHFSHTCEVNIDDY